MTYSVEYKSGLVAHTDDLRLYKNLKGYAMSESPNWTTGSDQLAYQKVSSQVELICDKHGSLGVMDRTWIGKAQVEHTDIFGCEAKGLQVVALLEALK